MHTPKPRNLLCYFIVYAAVANIVGWLLPIATQYRLMHLVAMLILLHTLRRFNRYGKLAAENKPNHFLWTLIIYTVFSAFYAAGTPYFDRSAAVNYADLQVAQGTMPSAAANEPGSRYTSAYDYFPFYDQHGHSLRLRCAAYPQYTDNCAAAYAHAKQPTQIRYHNGLIYEMQANGHSLLTYGSQIAAFQQQLAAERREYSLSLLWMLLIYSVPIMVFMVIFGRLWQQAPTQTQEDLEAASRQAARPLPSMQSAAADRREDARFLNLTQRNRRANAVGITCLAVITILMLGAKSLLHLAVGLLLIIPLCYAFWRHYRLSKSLSYQAVEHCFRLQHWENGQTHTQTWPADHFRGVLLRRLPGQLCQLLLIGRDGQTDVMIDEVDGHLFGKPGQLVRLQRHIHRSSGLPILSDGSL